MNRLRIGLERVAARTAVWLLLTTTALTARLLAVLCRKRERNALGGARRLLVIGTFHNENWFRSHILPLSATGGFGEIIVVTDRPLFDVPKVRYACPPAWLVRRLGRGLARAWHVLRTAARARPDIVMGYHIMPNGLLALLAARLCGARAIYQMTGGPVQISGGGAGSENPLLRRIGGPSAMLERRMFALVRQFDSIAVRGNQARRFLELRRLARHVAIIPGSVDTTRFAPRVAHAPRTFDLILVGRLIEQKQPMRFLELVAALRRLRPATRCALLGDGPLMPALRAQAEQLQLGDALTLLGNQARVDEYLARARLFVLTSSSEGLSIAMIEAMAAGLPVLAPDVGELTELLRDGENGFVIDPTQPEAAARRAAALLDDLGRWARFSRAARVCAVQRHSIGSVAQRWEIILRELALAASPPSVPVKERPLNAALTVAPPASAAARP